MALTSGARLGAYQIISPLGAVRRQNTSKLNFAPAPATIHRMLKLLIVVVRAFTLALRGHRELVLENLALRQQLAAFHRTTRCRLRARDRFFWMVLARSWENWRKALIVVQPDTVVRWHRDWLRRRWTRRSQQQHHGRPPIDQQIRTLVGEMATANPLWAHRGFMASCGRLASTSRSARSLAC